MSSNPQKFNGGEYLDKARDAAKGHPDQARSAIDKVQEAANRRTGGAFGSLIDKAGDFVEDTLGLPEDKASEPTTEPAEPTAEPTAEPAQPQRQSDSTGSGKLPG